jgi:hypothetical protein
MYWALWVQIIFSGYELEGIEFLAVMLTDLAFSLVRKIEGLWFHICVFPLVYFTPIYGF